jgi:hypothetical protein
VSHGRCGQLDAFRAGLDDRKKIRVLDILCSTPGMSDSATPKRTVEKARFSIPDIKVRMERRADCRWTVPDERVLDDTAILKAWA